MATPLTNDEPIFPGTGEAFPDWDTTKTTNREDRLVNTTRTATAAAALAVALIGGTATTTHAAPNPGATVYVANTTKVAGVCKRNGPVATAKFREITIQGQMLRGPGNTCKVWSWGEAEQPLCKGYEPVVRPFVVSAKSASYAVRGSGECPRNFGPYTYSFRTGVLAR